MTYAEQGSLYTYQDAIRGNWVPTLSATVTPPNLGTGGTEGDFVYHAGWVRARFLITFGTSGSIGNGIYEMGGLPIPPDIGVFSSLPIGQAHLRDFGTASHYRTCALIVGGVIRFSSEGGVEVTQAVPFTWANNDSLRGTIHYKAVE